MKVVANTSVLIALAKLGYLQVMTGLFDTVIIARYVLEEAEDERVSSSLNDVIEAGSVKVAQSSGHQLMEMLSATLGRGEAETIALALELKVDACLLDDLRARKTARRLGIKIFGTLSILKALIDNERIQEKPLELCKRLIKQGFWISKDLCLHILSNTES